jgi:hypothetical protein
MRVRHVFSLGIPTLLLVLASNPAFAAPPKACDFITAPLASAVYGSPLHPGKEGTITTMGSECVFEDGKNGTVTFGIGNVADIAAAMGGSPAQIAKIIATPDGDHPQTIPSLGEWNSYNPDGFDPGIKVLYHGKFLTLTANGSKNPGLKNAMADALRQIMQKL